MTGAGAGSLPAATITQELLNTELPLLAAFYSAVALSSVQRPVASVHICTGPRCIYGTRRDAPCTVQQLHCDGYVGLWAGRANQILAGNEMIASVTSSKRAVYVGLRG